MSIYILTLLISVQSGYVCLPKSWHLSWRFTSSRQISFSLQLNQQTISSFDWVGIGFKYEDDPRPGMTGADLVSIQLGSELKDAYAECECEPTYDEDLLGTQNLQDFKYNENYFIYSWTREIDSGDKYDLVYRPESKLIVLWAAGKTVSGVQLKHAKNNYGSTRIVLRDSFESDCEELINLS